MSLETMVKGECVCGMPEMPICAEVEICGCLDCYLMKRDVCAKCNHDKACHPQAKTTEGSA